ncbi:hypothetical protein [Dyadobacter fermentans]|uniref:HNH nuclease domain-containing protein n=1 Tax=Dyadobacter fermentans (strain ATCC 700827 / DSM 18053 / CIP 107007 / KCTC 52180 / NS114) TaxID=471854 RepID=C6W378_DYAFD|nr:hypothetical protein [Dyadobacter fermentans]ACT92182.1 hypothetical protein Dfer_0929 [Dyadobacter fermentans DSM 18053]
MRNVTRSYLITDAPDILQAEDTIAASTIIAKAGDASGIKRSLYSDPYTAGPDEGNQSRVIDKLNNWYFGKCAYCERFYKLDVEHFRPKGEIRDENNALTSNIGYYWLGYEWSNLLPSCISCNRDGGKNSKFPYIAGGKTVTAPTFNESGNLDREHCIVDHELLVGELPALLNPEVDLNVERFFAFEIDDDTEGIRIKGVDADRRGEITAIVCKLNRSEIRRERLQHVVMEFVNSVHNSVAVLKSSGDNTNFKDQLNLHIQKIYRDCDEIKLSHTLLRKYIVATPLNFQKIVIPFIIPEFKAILSEAFTNYVHI